MTDAPALETFDRALLWARLGKVWWGHDTEKARRWFQKAIEIVEFAPDQESLAHRGRRVAAARALLSIIAPLDKKISSPLTAILTSPNEASEGDRGENAQALADTALALVESDPTRAAELGSASLHTGRTAQIVFLFYKLRAKDSGLADRLFDEALAIVSAGLDSELMSHLASVAFPQQSLDPYFKPPVPPDGLRARLLNILAEDLQVRPVLGSDENTACGFAPIAAPLLEQFDHFLPQQAASVRLSLTVCRTKSDSLDQKSEDSLSDQPRKSVDDLLEAARDAPNPSVRVKYLVRAARMASEQKDFDRAIAILERMSSEEREQFKEPWKGWRWEFAAASAYAHYQREEYGPMRKVIDETPLDLRPFAQIFFANQLAEHNRILAIEYFEVASKDLAKADIANPAKAGMYLEIMRQYVRLQPGEALKVLREAVAVLNRIESSSPHKNGGSGNSATDEPFVMWAPIDLPSGLVEIDDFGTSQVISSIKAPLMRVRIGLGFLTSVMEHRPTGRLPKNKIAGLK
jgi:tetratricopeptide (TPR) repeat protein